MPWAYVETVFSESPFTVKVFEPDFEAEKNCPGIIPAVSSTDEAFLEIVTGTVALIGLAFVVKTMAALGKTK